MVLHRCIIFFFSKLYLKNIRMIGGSDGVLIMVVGMVEGVVVVRVIIRNIIVSH